MLTINGRVRLLRRRWHSPGEGTTTPLDEWLDTLESTISLGVREMACRLNGDGKNEEPLPHRRRPRCSFQLRSGLGVRL